MMTVGKLTESCWVIDLSKPRILVDTNVLLDLVSKDRPAHERVVQTVRNVIAASGEMLVATSSLKDAYCIYARHYGCESAAREAVSYLEDVFDLRSLEPKHIRKALLSPEPDFEDGIVRAIAEDEGCDYILTRDAKGFDGSKAPKIEPEELSVFATEKR